MVTHTFRQPGANEPVDVQRLTSCPAPFIILTREVRWHTGLPYGYPHLSSTRGERARWHTETSIVSHTFFRPDPWSQVILEITSWLPAPFVNWGQTSPLTWRDWHRLLHYLPSRDIESGGRRRYLMVIRAFRQPRGKTSTVSGWCWPFGADHFQIFCRFSHLLSGNIHAQQRARFFSAGQGWSGAMEKGSNMVVQPCRFHDAEVCWRFWCIFFSFWTTGSAGGDINRSNDVPLERN